MSSADELLDVVSKLGEDERRVLLAIARRLALGAKAYGPLDVNGDRRNWRAEATEELLDACVYLSCQSIKEKDES